MKRGAKSGASYGVRRRLKYEVKAGMGHSADLSQLKSLQDSGRMSDYLNCVREMDGHGGVVFPHCASDARKEGHVVPVVSFDAFRLQACSEDGSLDTCIM